MEVGGVADEDVVAACQVVFEIGCCAVGEAAEEDVGVGGVDLDAEGGECRGYAAGFSEEGVEGDGVVLGVVEEVVGCCLGQGINGPGSP